MALLATARDLRRGRAWLQDRLWSDRAPKQASGSLRQAIHDMKRALGPYAGIVRADRLVVALDTEQVQLNDKPSGPAREHEFLMGLDARDPEFEDWLRDMRAHHSAPSVPLKTQKPQKALCVAQVGSDGQDGDLSFLEAIFLDVAQKSLAELLDVEFFFGLPNQSDIEKGDRADVLLRVQGVKNLNGDRWLRATLEGPANLQLFWSHQVAVPRTDQISQDNFACTKLAHHLVETFLMLLQNGTLRSSNSSKSDADRLAASAFKKMFTMRAHEVDEAYDLLATAIEIKPRGLYTAWQAQVNTIRHVEQQQRDIEGLYEESAALIQRALETEPLNSNVMAAAANTRLIFENDTLQAGALSRQAVVLNRANPLAWWAWSNANLYGGNFEIAYTSAMTAQSLGSQSSIEFWTAFQAALTAAVRGKMNEAVAYSALSAALAPNFRPPLRYLAAIAARTGHVKNASRALERLAELEADFSVDRMVNDPSYPVSIMRKTKLIEPQKLFDLF